MVNFALLVLRLTLGGLLMGHGSQKLFGWFGGHGLQGTSGWLHSLGLTPGKFWASLAGFSEFGGGLLTVLGFLNPFGPVAASGAMLMAISKAHWGKPIWVTAGGAELPVTNLSIITALVLAGPGEYSLDHVFGIRLPRWVALPGIALALISAVYGHMQEPPQQEQTDAQAQASQEQPTETATAS